MARARAFRKDDNVLCDRGPGTANGSKAWAAFAGRKGVVRIANNMGEVGVVFTDKEPPTPLGEGIAWFLPSDLVLLEPEGASE